jgi:AraC-like DNA-binding protein
MAQGSFTVVTRSADATVQRIRCNGCDPRRAPDEIVGAHHLWLVTEGTFAVRGARGRTLLDPTTALVVAKDDPYTVRHPNGPDLCLSITGAVVDELAQEGTRALPLEATAYAALVGAVAGGRENLDIAELVVALDRPRHRGATARRDGELVAALKDEIRRTYAQGATLGELVATVGGSVFHACHAFRTATGTTMNAYRNEVRLRHALARLVDGDEPLAQVASAAGFASQSHLTNRFTARFGTSPGKVRAARSL